MLNLEDSVSQTVFLIVVAVVLGGAIVWFYGWSSAKRRESFLENELRDVKSKLLSANDQLHAPLSRTVEKTQCESLDVSHSELSMRCLHLEKQLAQEQDYLAECREEIILLNDTLSIKEQRITLLEEDARELRANFQSVEKEEDDYLIKGLKSNLAELRGKLPQMETRLHVGEGLAQDLQKQLLAEQEEKAELLARLESKERHIHAVDVLLSNQKEDTEVALQARMDAERALLSVQKILSDLGYKDASQVRLVDMDAANTKRSPESKMFSAKPDQVDDLKQLKGIGRKLERKLHGLGVYQFAQLAAFDDADLEWLDEKLCLLEGQSKKDAWVRQATAKSQDNGQ